MERIVKRNNLIGKKLSDVAILTHPLIPFTYEQVLEYINGTYILQFKPEREQDVSIQLKGEPVAFSYILKKLPFILAFTNIN